MVSASIRGGDDGDVLDSTASADLTGSSSGFASCVSAVASGSTGGVLLLSLLLSSPSPLFVEGSRWKPSLVAGTCTRQHTVDNVRMQRMVWRFCLLHASGDGWLHNTRETHVNSVDHTWARQYPRRVLSAPCCCLLSAVVVELMVGDASPPDGA